MTVEQDGSKLAPGGGGESTPVDTAKGGLMQSVSNDEGGPPKQSDQFVHSHSTALALPAESQNDSTIRSRKEEEERKGKGKFVARGGGSAQESIKESNICRSFVQVIDMQSSSGCVNVEDEDYLKPKVLLTSFSLKETDKCSSQSAFKESKESLNSAGIPAVSPVFKEGGAGVPVNELSKDESVHKAITENTNTSEQVKKDIEEDNQANFQQQSPNESDAQAIMTDTDQAKVEDSELYKHPIVLTEGRILSESLETSVHEQSRDESAHKASAENINISEQIEKNIEEGNRANFWEETPDKSGEAKAILVDTDQAKEGDFELYTHSIVLTEGRKLSEFLETSVQKLSKDESAHKAIAENTNTSDQIEKNIEEDNRANCRQEKPDKSGDAKAILVDTDQAKEGDFKLYKHSIVVTEGRKLSESLETSVHKLSKDESGHKAIAENTNTSDQIKKNIEEDNCANCRQEKPDKSGDAKDISVDTDQAEGDSKLYKHSTVLTEGRKFSDSLETSVHNFTKDESAHKAVAENTNTSEQIEKNIEEDSRVNCWQEKLDKSGDAKAISVDTDQAEGDSKLCKHSTVLTEGRKLSESLETSVHKLYKDESAHKAITENSNTSEQMKKNIEEENRANCWQGKPDKSEVATAILVDTDEAKEGDSKLYKHCTVLTEGKKLSKSLETSVQKLSKDESAHKAIAENINTSEQMEKIIEEDNHVNCQQQKPDISGDVKVILVDIDQACELYKHSIVLTEGRKFSESLETSVHKLSKDESAHKAIAESTNTSEQIEKNIEEENRANCRQGKPDKSEDATAILVDTDEAKEGDSKLCKHSTVLTEGKKLSESLETSVQKLSKDESAHKAIAENINTSEQIEKMIEEDKHVNCQQQKLDISGDVKAILVDIDQASVGDSELYKHPIVLTEGRNLSESSETSMHKLSKDESAHNAIADNINTSELIEKNIEEGNHANCGQEESDNSGDVKAILVSNDQAKEGDSELYKHPIVLTEWRNLSVSLETSVHKLSKEESAYKAISESTSTSERIRKNIEEDNCMNRQQQNPNKSDVKVILIDTDQAKVGDSELYKHPIILTEGRILSESLETSVHKQSKDESAHKAISQNLNTSEGIEKNIEEDNPAKCWQEESDKSGDAKAISVGTDQAKEGDSKLNKYPVVLIEGRKLLESLETSVHQLSKDEAVNKAIAVNINTSERIKKNFEEDNHANCKQETPDKSGTRKAVLEYTDQAMGGDSKLYKHPVVITEGRKLSESSEISVNKLSKDESAHKAIPKNIDTSEKIKKNRKEDNRANFRQEKPDKSGSLKAISVGTAQVKEGDSKLYKKSVVRTEGRKLSESSKTSVRKLSKDNFPHKAISVNINTSEQIGKNHKEDDCANRRPEKPTQERHSVDKSVHAKAILINKDKPKEGDSKLYKHPIVRTEGRKLSESSEMSVHKLPKDESAHKAIAENINTSEQIEENRKEDESANCWQEKPAQESHVFDKSIDAEAISVDEDQAKEGDFKLYKHPIVLTEGRKLSEASEKFLHELSKDESSHKVIAKNINNSEKTEKNRKEDDCANCCQDKSTQEKHPFDTSGDTKAILVDKYQVKEGDSKFSKLSESSEMSLHKLSIDEYAHKAIADNIGASDGIEKNHKEDDCVNCQQEKPTKERHAFDTSDVKAILPDKDKSKEGGSKLSKHPIVLLEGRELSESSEMSAQKLSKEESVHKAIAENINTSERIECRSPAEKNHKEDDPANCRQEKPTNERYRIDKSGDAKAILVDNDKAKEGDSKLYQHPIVLTEGRKLLESLETSVPKLSKDESAHKAISVTINTSKKIEKNHKEDDRVNCWQEKPTQERYPFHTSGDAKAILVNKDQAKEGDSKLYEHPIVQTEGRKLSESLETSVHKLSKGESAHKAISDTINTSEQLAKNQKEDDCANCRLEKTTQERYSFDKSRDVTPISLVKDEAKEGDSKLSEHSIMITEERKFSECSKIPEHKLSKDESAQKAIADNINISQRIDLISPAEKRSKEDNHTNCQQEKPTQGHPANKSDTKEISVDKDEVKKEDYKAYKIPTVLTEGRKLSEESEILDSRVAQLQQACDSDTLSVAYPPTRQQVIEISEQQQGSRASWGGCCGMVDWLLKK